MQRISSSGVSTFIYSGCSEAFELINDKCVLKYQFMNATRGWMIAVFVLALTGLGTLGYFTYK